MSIYTKTGDTGTTALFGGQRVSKYNPQVEAYGVLDEATCFIGLAHESITDSHMQEFLTTIQLDLYIIMAYLSGAPLQKKELSAHINQMEQDINTLENELPKLTRFILPQGSEPAVRFHIARAKVRSAERRIVEFTEQKEKQSTDDYLIIQYMNRLSDFLFMLGRKHAPIEKKT